MDIYAVAYSEDKEKACELVGEVLEGGNNSGKKGKKKGTVTAPYTQY